MGHQAGWPLLRVPLGVPQAGSAWAVQLVSKKSPDSALADEVDPLPVVLIRSRPQLTLVSSRRRRLELKPIRALGPNLARESLVLASPLVREGFQLAQHLLLEREGQQAQWSALNPVQPQRPLPLAESSYRPWSLQPSSQLPSLLASPA